MGKYTGAWAADTVLQPAWEDREGLEDADYPREDWQAEVENNDTQLSYWEWVDHRSESDADEDDENDAGW